MRIKIAILLTFFTTVLFAQSQDEILAEAYLLYRSEKASWHGTDIFMQRFPEKRSSLKGYLSYTEEKEHKCIFYDKDGAILATIAFDDSFVPEAAKINSQPRDMTNHEKELWTIREKAIAEITKDTLFKRYEGMNFNPIPLIYNKKKMVYLLTGTNQNGVVIFGNDYLITFDKKNNIKTKKALHKNILVFEYSEKDQGATAMHNHQEETGDLITATDICTLMLYCPYTGWESHIVISEKNVSIWNCEKNNLLVLTREAWENIANGSKEDKKD